jgi:GH24 family phage-related lysozyme (muramidase)
MTRQFDEGVRDVMRVLGLAALVGSAATFGVKAINKELEKSFAPTQVKIEALKQAEEEATEPEIKEVIRQAAILVKPSASAIDKINKMYNQKVSKREVIEMAKPYIIQHEIYGNDIRSKINSKFLTAYKDDAKIPNWTIGIGHKVLPGEPKVITAEQALEIFDKDLNRVYDTNERIFGDTWNDLSPDMKVALMDASFRGEIKKDYAWPRYIKARKFNQAANEYLNSNEYRSRLAKGNNDSVVRRNNSNAAIFRGEGKVKDFIR